MAKHITSGVAACPSLSAYHERRRQLLALAGLSALIPLNASASSAQDFPSRPIRMIVPFGAGGSTDTLARIVAEPMGKILNQPVVVENRPGAGGAIGLQALVKAAPDGYTIGMGAVGGMSILGPLYGGKLPYDPLNDFVPITQLVSQPSVILVNRDVPAGSLTEFLAWLKERPNENYASGGIGTMSHLTGEIIKRKLGLNIQHVAYKGDLPGISDVLAGHVKIMILNISPALPYVQDGKARIVAVTSKDRSSLLPDVQSLSEVLGETLDLVAWQGFYAPAQTPEPIVSKLNSAVVQALKEPETKQRLEESGAVPVGNTSREFHAFMEEEARKWKSLVELSEVKIEQ